MLDLWRGTLSLRKASVLARHLPSGAQTWIACGLDNAWTLQDYLLAASVDALHAANWQRGANASDPKPKPIRRPADIRAQADDATLRATRARAFADRQRATRNEPEEG